MQNQGIRVTKSNRTLCCSWGSIDTTDTRIEPGVSDYLASNIEDPLSRVPGVGDVNVFGSAACHAHLAQPRASGCDVIDARHVISAITAQNSEVAAGDVGGLPAPEGQMLNATVTAQSRLQTVKQFDKIVLKTLARRILGEDQGCCAGSRSVPKIIPRSFA